MFSSSPAGAIRVVDEAALNSEVLDIMHWQTNPRTCTTRQHYCYLSDSCIGSAVTVCLHSRYVCKMLYQLYSVVKRTQDTPEVSVITVPVSTVCMFDKTGMKSVGPICINPSTF